MICPKCETETELAYSMLSKSLICLEEGCDFEVEMSMDDARELLEPEDELIYV